MVISRLLFDPHHPDAAPMGRDCHHLHRLLMRAFPVMREAGGGPRHAAGLLFRREGVTASSTGDRVLVQSEAHPDWSALPSTIWADVARPWSVSDGDSLLEGLRGGRRYAFRLLANPTRRRALPSEPHARRCGRRVALCDRDAWVAWLVRKGTDSGFRLLETDADTAADSVDDTTTNGRGAGGLHDGEQDSRLLLRTREMPRVLGWKPASNRSSGQLAFASVLYDGLLEVTDADRLRGTVRRGIGTGRAFGFGLLTLIPVEVDPRVATAAPPLP